MRLRIAFRCRDKPDTPRSRQHSIPESCCRPASWIGRSFARRAFADPEARARLEAAVHPRSGAGLSRDGAWRGVYGVAVVPLLRARRPSPARSTGFWWSIAPRTSRFVSRRPQRANSRGGACHHGDPARSRRPASDADDVLDNSGPPDAVAPQVAELDRRWQETRGGPSPRNVSQATVKSRTAHGAECRSPLAPTLT